MPQRTSLLFGVHAHQPVGNFPEVLMDAHLRCYRALPTSTVSLSGFSFRSPFLRLAPRLPDASIILKTWRYCGKWCNCGNKSSCSAQGDTEPVLAVIPNRDRIGQIQAFSNKLAAKLGQRPQGAWLTERVWESTVVPALADCGIRYVIVDDYHFLCAGRAPAGIEWLLSPPRKTTRTLDLFPYF
jgi:hypothetical protein